jgi:dTMP kinase
MFITLEGNEGAGKSSIALAIKKELENRGYSLILSREPGGSRIAEQVRDILLERSNTNMSEETEALLYAASRAQHLNDIVLPALAKGKIVLCDRFIDSSMAYQGYAREIGMDKIWQINQFAINGCMPSLTLYLKIDPRKGLERVHSRGEELNRLDLMDLSFHEKVAKGYDILAQKYPKRIVTIDASKEFDQVLSDCLDAIMARMKADHE